MLLRTHPALALAALAALDLAVLPAVALARALYTFAVINNSNSGGVPFGGAGSPCTIAN